MRRVTLCVLMLLLLMSCRTKKETRSSVLNERYIKKIEAFIQQRDSLSIERNKLYRLNEAIEIIEREFDTNHEPDSLGNYPIIKETVTKIDRESSEEATEKEKSVSDKKTNIDEEEDLKKKEDVKIKDEVKENSSFKYLIIFFILVVITVIIVFVKQGGFFRK